MRRLLGRGWPLARIARRYGCTAGNLVQADRRHDLTLPASGRVAMKFVAGDAGVQGQTVRKLLRRRQCRPRFFGRERMLTPAEQRLVAAEYAGRLTPAQADEAGHWSGPNLAAALGLHLSTFRRRLRAGLYGEVREIRLIGQGGLARRIHWQDAERLLRDRPGTPPHAI